MKIKQSKGVAITLTVIIVAPILFVCVFIIFDRGWADFVDTRLHEAFYVLLPLMVIVLLTVDKVIELKDDYIIIHHMKVFKRKIDLEDIRFVRLGKRLATSAKGASIPTSFLVIHTKNDKEKVDNIVGKRAMIVDLNFSKENREIIYKYFENKGLLESRKRIKYKNYS